MELQLALLGLVSALGLSLGKGFNVTKTCKVSVKQVYCTERNASLVPDLNCLVKPTRDGAGRVSIFAQNVAPLDEVWFRFVVYFKYGHIFRQWMINMDHDWCGVQEKSVVPDLFFEFIVDEWQRKEQSLARKCPLQGDLGIRNFNFADFVESVLPQLIPRGTYKLQLRFYSKRTNSTYVNIFIVFDLRPLDPTKEF